MESRAAYSAELERAKARNEAQAWQRRLDSRARRLLGVAGWHATMATLAVVVLDDELIPADQHGLVWYRALEIQCDERYTGRRIAPEEASVGKRGPKPGTITKPIPLERREKIVDCAASLLQKDRQLAQNALRLSINELFSVSISEQNWYTTYMPKVRIALKNGGPASNGKAPADVSATEVAVPPEADPLPPANSDAPAMPAAGPEVLPEIAGAIELTAEPDGPPPLLSVERAGSGRLRVYLDAELDDAGAMQLVSTIGYTLARLAGARE